MKARLPAALLAEFIGTATLLCAVVGSGIGRGSMLVAAFILARRVSPAGPAPAQST